MFIKYLMISPGFEALQNTIWRPLLCLIHTCMDILLAWHWHEQKNLSTVHYWTSTFCVSVDRHTVAAFRRELVTKCWIIDALHSLILNLIHSVIPVRSVIRKCTCRCREYETKLELVLFRYVTWNGNWTRDLCL
jgi:hypothetical protein